MASLYERIRWYYFGGQQKTAKDIEAAAVLLSTEYAATPTPTSPESVTEEQKVSNGSRKDSSPSVTTSSIVSSANSTSSAMPARPSNHRKLIREKSQGQVKINHHQMRRARSTSKPR